MTPRLRTDGETDRENVVKRVGAARFVSAAALHSQATVKPRNLGKKQLNTDSSSEGTFVRRAWGLVHPMVDPRRQSGPRCPTAETLDSAVCEGVSDHPVPGGEDGGRDLSHDERAAAAVEAVRQMEAYLSGKSTRTGHAPCGTR